MNTTVQPRTTSVPFLTAVRPQRVLQINGLPKPIQIIWSTPRQLWAFAAAIVCASTLFCFASTHAITRSREAIHSVGEDCAPSIVAAQKIRSAFADFDANLENLLICEPGSKAAEDARKTAESRHREIAATLVTAAQNITFGDAEMIPITRMVDGFATYESLMTKTQTLEAKHDHAGALAANREAVQLMDETILNQAEALDRANATQLDRTYARQKFDAREAIAFLLIAGAVTLCLLAAAQVYLLRRMHRFVNPALLGATFITLFQLGNTTLRNVQAASQLRTAVDDAFASVHFLSNARALAYCANGEESRFLFDRERAAYHEKAFFAEADGIAAVPSGDMALDIARNARLASADADVAAGLPRGFSGLLEQELRNVTFPHEREAAADALARFGDYLAVDKRIRVAEKTGHHSDAVRICVSYEESGSNRVFEDFNTALAKVLQINQNAFESAKAASFHALSGGEASIAITTLLAIAGTIAGFWPRIREFQA